LERSRTAEDIKAVVEKLAEWLTEPGQASLRRTLVSWLRQSLMPVRLGGAPMPEVSELSEVRDMLQERVIQWTEEWKQDGLRQGRVEGLRAAMVKLVERRFGSLTPEQRERVEAADLEDLADRIFEARSFEELLGE